MLSSLASESQSYCWSLETTAGQTSDDTQSLQNYLEIFLRLSKQSTTYCHHPCHYYRSAYLRFDRVNIVIIIIVRINVNSIIIIVSIISTIIL